jgi:hypothetical protein
MTVARALLREKLCCERSFVVRRACLRVGGWGMPGRSVEVLTLEALGKAEEWLYLKQYQ